ncbi:hypothetical protein [Ornithinibacillus xuwenensis]|uniref:Uncharacterized protein n=1 Tax=Ornithinibacillus xuwenensis TaxID=3144668 RepID=A0ABU9XBP3_9BACI
MMTKQNETNNSLSINVDVNTTNLTAKLKVISKHAIALAEELEQMDEMTCPMCNNVLLEENYFADEVLHFSKVECSECGYSKTSPR